MKHIMWQRHCQEHGFDCDFLKDAKFSAYVRQHNTRQAKKVERCMSETDTTDDVFAEIITFSI